MEDVSQETLILFQYVVDQVAKKRHSDVLTVKKSNLRFTRMLSNISV